MAKNVMRKAEKAVDKLRSQQILRTAIGEIRDEVAEQTRHSTRRLAYDLNGNPH